jgi:hypothetical protein
LTYNVAVGVKRLSRKIERTGVSISVGMSAKKPLRVIKHVFFENPRAFSAKVLYSKCA